MRKKSASKARSRLNDSPKMEGTLREIPESLKSVTGFVISQLADALQASTGEILKEHKINPRQLGFLTLLASSRPLNQHKSARAWSLSSDGPDNRDSYS